MSLIRRRGLLAICALTVTLAASACSSGGANNDPPSGTGSGAGTYTAAEVAAASGTYKVVPIFAVPKTLPKRYRFAFLSPGASFPFFASWSQGMKDAAKFYGVDLDEADLNFQYDNQLSAYNQIAVKQPDVIGSNPMNDATYNAAHKDGTKILLIDNTFKDVAHFGVNDEQVGQLAVDTLADQAKAKTAGDWKGKKVSVVGITAPNCTSCDARVHASFAQAEKVLNIPASNTIMLTPQGQDPTSSAGATFTDFLTSHPQDAIVVVSYGDETVVGAVTAAKAAHRGGDILSVSNGGDGTARAALRDTSNAGILLAAIDYQPYAEGWNWIEASIAVAMGQSFGTYRVDRVLTSANVDQYYPNDKK